jgi:N-acetylgalactosamine-N,N'-diacetylbacillosaminyl-diphospho-undecaprenol 4-alpha-N-acetylgalactosaminyltransferase
MGEDLLTVCSVKKDKLEVIPNFVDIEKLKNLAQEPIPKEEEFLFSKTNTFISVSRLFPQKNYHFLLEALSRYKENGNDFNFIALGDGPLKDELEEYSKSLGLQNNCYFLGYRENPYKYLSRSDLFVLPSLYEGMSNSLIQSMALNLKVLVSDSQPTSLELIEKYENGKFYSQNNIDNFILSLSDLLTENSENIKAELFNNSLEKYIEQIHKANI